MSIPKRTIPSDIDIQDMVPTGKISVASGQIFKALEAVNFIFEAIRNNTRTKVVIEYDPKSLCSTIDAYEQISEQPNEVTSNIGGVLSGTMGDCVQLSLIGTNIGYARLTKEEALKLSKRLSFLATQVVE